MDWSAPCGEIFLEEEERSSTLENLRFKQKEQTIKMGCVPSKLNEQTNDTKRKQPQIYDNQITKLNIDRRLKQWQQTKICAIRDCKLKHFPIELQKLSKKELKTIDGSNNMIKEIPVDLLLTQANLQRIVLENNKITDVPIELFMNLKQLKVLNLSRNSLKSIPREISMLRNLKELNVSENEMLVRVSFKGLGMCDSLELVDLSGCKSLKKFDDDDVVLGVEAKNDDDGNVKEERFRNLVTLIANGCSFYDLGDNFGAPQKLKTLVLDDNANFRKLPENIFTESIALARVSMHNCPSISIEEIERMPNFVDFCSRIKDSHDKKLTSGILLGATNFGDDGLDRRAKDSRLDFKVSL